MANISTVFSDKGKGPYSNALKVRVVAADQPVKYRAKDSSEKSSLTTAVCDGDKVVQAVCFDATKFAKFQVDTTLVLRDIIRKNGSYKCYKGFYICTNSCSRQLKAEGVTLLNPPPSETIPITTALSSPLEKKVSISGKIMQEDEPRQVNVRGEDVTIKTVTVEDTTGKAKVTLWRDVSNTNLRPVDHVTITDVIVNHWQNKTTLSSTTKSKLEQCDAPIEELKVQVDAVGLDGEFVELFLDTEDTILCKAWMLQDALATELVSADEINVEMATVSGPIHLQIKVQNILLLWQLVFKSY